MLSPNFVAKHVGRITCPKCHRTPEGTITVLGNGLIPIKSNGKVSVQLDFYCVKCKAIQRFKRSFDRPSLLHLIDKSLGETGVRWDFQFPTEVKLEPGRTPSILPGTPDEPISDADLKAAQQIMEKMTFKRTSKSWREFLKRMREGSDASE